MEPMSIIGMGTKILYVDGEINDVKMMRVEQNPYVCVCMYVCNDDISAWGARIRDRNPQRRVERGDGAPTTAVKMP